MITFDFIAVKLRRTVLKKLKIEKDSAIIDLNAPNGSRDILFQIEVFGQYRHRHFVGFQSHFHLNMTLKYDVTDAMLQDNEKNESVISQKSFV